MPFFTYRCKNHGDFRKILRKREAEQPCVQCGEPSVQIFKVGTTSIVERLDNGAMPRAVERLHNIEELMDERDRLSQERDGLVSDDESEEDS